MNIISPSEFIMLARARSRAMFSSRDERLRRAGYRDGERIPRVSRHWANRKR